MTPPPLLLCCVQLGISVRDLDLLTIGMVNDMYMQRAGTTITTTRLSLRKTIWMTFAASNTPVFKPAKAFKEKVN